MLDGTDRAFRVKQDTSLGDMKKVKTRMNRYLLMMVLCCAIPLGLIFSLPYFGLTSLSGGLLLLIVVLCLLIHLWMVFHHGRGRHRTPKHKEGGLR